MSLDYIINVRDLKTSFDRGDHSYPDIEVTTSFGFTTTLKLCSGEIVGPRNSLRVGLSKGVHKIPKTLDYKLYVKEHENGFYLKKKRGRELKIHDDLYPFNYLVKCDMQTFRGPFVWVDVKHFQKPLDNRRRIQYLGSVQKCGMKKGIPHDKLSKMSDEEIETTVFSSNGNRDEFRMKKFGIKKNFKKEEKENGVNIFE